MPSYLLCGYTNNGLSVVAEPADPELNKPDDDQLAAVPEPGQRPRIHGGLPAQRATVR